MPDDPTVLFIETTPTESPTGAVVVAALSSDQDGHGGIKFPGIDTDAEVEFVESTPTESPTGAVAIYAIGLNPDAAALGAVQGDEFGNVISDQKRRGAIL